MDQSGSSTIIPLSYDDDRWMWLLLWICCCCWWFDAVWQNEVNIRITSEHLSDYFCLCKISGLFPFFWMLCAVNTNSRKNTGSQFCFETFAKNTLFFTDQWKLNPSSKCCIINFILRILFFLGLEIFGFDNYIYLNRFYFSKKNYCKSQKQKYLFIYVINSKSWNTCSIQVFWIFHWTD